MKKFIAFLLTTALIMTMGPASFALKGGDADVAGVMAFEFNSESAVSTLHYVNRDNAADPNVKLVASQEQTKSYAYSAKLTVVGAYGTKFFFTDKAAEAFNDEAMKYVNIQIYNAQSTQRRLIFNVTYNASGRVYVQPGWNVVTLPVESCFNGGTRSLSTTSYEEKGDEATAFNIAEVAGTDAITAGDVYYIDRIWLSATESSDITYNVSSDGAILWQFNNTDAVSAAAALNAAAASGSPSMTLDNSFVNAYDISASFTTSTKRRMQIKLDSKNIIQTKDENGNYVYDYINFIIGNPQNTDVTFGYGYYGNNQAVTLPANSWSLLSVKIDELFWNGNSQNGRTALKYSDLSGIAFQMNDSPGGNNNSSTPGIKYNFDMIWVSKGAAAVGVADEKGTVLSQIPLTCTDAAVTDNGDGTAYASCKISNWPGERFVVIFASYTNDNALHAITLSKDYDGGQNIEKLVETASIEVPEGGKTKIMVWNGFGDISPMALSTEK